MALKRCRYSIKDAADGKDPEEFVQLIMINSKNTGTTIIESSQILIIYKHIDAELQQDLLIPATTLIISKLLETLYTRKQNWFDIYSKPNSN